jgi:hypothetical protein
MKYLASNGFQVILNKLEFIVCDFLQKVTIFNKLMMSAHYIY